MVSKILRFLEEHLEKIVLAIVGLVCMYFLLSRVVFSPNKVSYNNQLYSPSEIDSYISQEAKEVDNKLSGPPEKVEVPKGRLSEFLADLNSAISMVNSSLWPVVPQVPLSGVAGGTHSYRAPEIGFVTDSEIEYIRAVVYDPVEEITPENTYDKNSTNEPNDLDLITMQASFNVASLYKEFFESYAGDDVPEQWRDPCYAQPVFAAVNLQRQKLGKDGMWSDWENVPRAKIDHRRNLFKIIEKIQDLPPGGLKVRMLQYKGKDTQIDLLQPPSYQIASAKEEWFPPVLHRKFLKLQAAEDLEEKRREREDQSSDRDSSRSGRLDTRNRRSTTSRSSTRPGADYGNQPGVGDRNTRSRNRRTGNQPGEDIGLYPDMGGTSSRRTRGSRTDSTVADRDMLLMQREAANKPSINDVYDEFDEIMLTRDTDFSELDELMFWAHDDTVEPRNTYRYRIRIGVFNPSPGPETQNAILWSDFSGVSRPIHIPGRMYFFAMDTQEAEQSVRVQISKYVLGYWYSDYFKVKSGEVIGELREREIPRASNTLLADSRSGRPASPRITDQVDEPEEIDYTTGAVLVDIATVDDWITGSKISPRQYKDMLYSYDGIEIEHMGIGSKVWSEELKTAFGDITTAQRTPKEPLKPWDSARRRRRPAGFEPGTGEVSPEMYEEMMMMQGMNNY